MWPLESGICNKVSPRKYVYIFYCGSYSKCIQIFWDSLYFVCPPQSELIAPNDKFYHKAAWAIEIILYYFAKTNDYTLLNHSSFRTRWICSSFDEKRSKSLDECDKHRLIQSTTKFWSHRQSDSPKSNSSWASQYFKVR